MNKKIKRPSKQNFAEFADKISAKWQLRTQHSIPSKLDGTQTSESILRDLVSMPTITGNYEANHECFDYIDRFLSEHGLYVKRYEWNGIESLVATTRRTKTPTVCLFGHIDVVPAPSDQFQLSKRDDKYFGRGVLDMKGGVAAFLGAVQELGDTVSDYDLAVIITSDEEVGGFDGAAKIAEEGYRPKMMIIPDGGGNWNLERFAKGIWHLTVETNGKSAHGSRPWEGENAIDKLVSAVAEIKKLFPTNPSPETSTINVGMIQGGDAINQIPSVASASMDMRFASAKEQASIVGKVETLIEKLDGVRLTTEVEADTMSNDPNDAYLQAYAACTEKVIGHPIEWIISNAGNDGRFFTKFEIPCAIGYPPGANHHGPEEYIEKQAYFQMQQIFVDYIRKMAKTKAPSHKVAVAK